MGNRRDPDLSKYEISGFAYRELLYFCWQYPEKAAKLRDLRSLTLAPPNGTPRGNAPGNPTERKAINALKYSTDCEMIEQTAIEAGAGIYSWLLKNITEKGMTWERLNPPCGRRQFYEKRRRFFYLLAYKKGLS